MVLNKGVCLIEKGHLKEFMENFQLKMVERGYDKVDIDNMMGKFYTNRIRVKYDNVTQDKMMDKLFEIAKSPGGIKYLMDNMDYWPEFEHRKYRNYRSIYKIKAKVYKD